MGRSELALQAQAERAAVGVVEEAVDRRGPGTGEQRELLCTVRAQAAGWARADAAAVVPLLQCLGARGERGDELRRIDQLVVLAAVEGPVQVLAGQLQPQVAREHAGTVATAGRVERLALVAGRVEH